MLLRGNIGYVLDAALTVFWVVGITASFSILDHMDGMCAGVAAMASIFFVMLAYLNGQTSKAPWPRPYSAPPPVSCDGISNPPRFYG